MKYLKSLLKLIVIIIGIIFLIFLIDYIRLNINYLLHKNEFTEAFDVQGIKNKYTPQGLTYSSKYNVAIQTSYNKKHSVSMIFITDLNTNKLIKKLKLLNHDGTEDNKHVGGITTDNNTVWITNDNYVDELDLDEIMTTEEETIKIKNSYELPNRGDFCLYDKGILWIGDFFLKGIYDCLDDNPLLMGYTINKDIDYAIPDYVISLPIMIQGMAITEDNKFIFTDSYTNLINSKLTIYDNVLEDKADIYTINGKEIPYYKLDKNNLLTTYKIPPMAEGLFLKDNNLYILFESASDTYWMALPKIPKILKYNLKEIYKK